MNRLQRVGSLAAFVVVTTLASAQWFHPSAAHRTETKRRRWGLAIAAPAPVAATNAYAGSVALVAGLLSLAARARRR